jgi:leucyl aminopeptidase
VRVEVQDASPEGVEADFLAVAVPDGDLEGAARTLDAALGGRIARLVEAGDVERELGTATLVHLERDAGAPRLILAPAGPRADLDAEALRTAGAAAARAAHAVGGTIAWVLDPELPVPAAEQARAATEGIALGSYDPARWRSKPNGKRPLERLVLVGSGEGVAEAATRAGKVADWTNRARNIINSPPNEVNPERLAAEAREIAGAVEHLEADALDRDAMRELGMGSLLAVAQGSHNEPRLVVLRYEPPNPTNPDIRLGFVGKAITFDTGGISLKPALHMEDMKGDMGGGGGVLEAMGALADLQLPVRAIAVIAAAENMPGGHAYRPGDILTAANGKTIEVTNTDAEGRLVLADALWYARREGATHVIDLATLTGAMEVALGDLYAGYFANDEAWSDAIAAAGARSGDLVWRFPLGPRYRRYVDSSFADMKNSSDLRQAGAVLAAEFLREFAGEGPWAHVDIAGPAFLERSRGDYMWQRGATGYGVRLLVELAQSFS